MYDGGPAFPQPISTLEGNRVACSDEYGDRSGMSLRDFFAGKIIEGRMAAGEYWDFHGLQPDVWRARWAHEVYEIADAMIEARNFRKQS